MFKKKEIDLKKESPRTLSKTSKKSARFRNPKGAAKYFAPYRAHKILDEIEIEDVEFDSNIIKETLSTDIWKSKDKLHPEVRKKLLKATKVFYDFLNISPIKLKDVTITGSMANYNYHESSDIDIHLITSYKSVDDNIELLDEFFATKKALWQKKHAISIKGHPVEFYVQDHDLKHHSSGVYSLIKEEWVIKPSRQDGLVVDEVEIKKKAADFINRIEFIEEMVNSDDAVKAIDKFKEDLREYRQKGLNSSAQEFSVENLVFKVLRNSGYLERLGDIKGDIVDKSLSLTEFDSADLEPEIEKASRNRILAPRWRETPMVKKESEDIPSGNNVLMIERGIRGLDEEKIEIIKDFISFCRQKLSIEKPVKVGLRKGRDSYIKTTASYLPAENENYVRCDGRSLVDILRSIAHELTHNRQLELGLFTIDKGVKNIDTRPGGIEPQANAVAGALIKDFVDNYGYERVHDMY